MTDLDRRARELMIHLQLGSQYAGRDTFTAIRAALEAERERAIGECATICESAARTQAEVEEDWRSAGMQVHRLRAAHASNMLSQAAEDIRALAAGREGT